MIPSLPLRLLFVWALLALAPPLSAARAQGGLPLAPASALDDLESLATELADHGLKGRPTGATLRLEDLLGPASAESEASPENLRRYVDALVSLATVDQASLPDRPVFRPSARMRGMGAIRSRAIEALDEVLAGPLGERCGLLLAEALVDGTRDLVHRQICSWMGATRRIPAARQALMTVARSLADRLRPYALFQLSGWPDPGVDLFLVRLAGKSFESGLRPHPVNVLLDRVELRGKPLAPRAATELAIRLGDMLLSRDWRKAARAVVLSKGLAPGRRVPLLIGSLEAWQRRASRGKGSPRIEDDIHAELQKISGRSISSNPDRWRTWWAAVEAGQAPLRVARDVRRPRSSAGFFGLRAVSDRVTFVLDVSGSMKAPWRTSEHSRYVEAIDQMMKHLQAMGEDARFNVILFSSDYLVSSEGLVRCTGRNLERARKSLLARQPKGGTNLRPAIEAALCLGPDRQVDLERLEADTIVVLCDGDTASGRDWVQPLMRRVQIDAQVRIHCVLIGTAGDGTLEALASSTGGDFLRID